MGMADYSRLHRRVYGLSGSIKKKLETAHTPGRVMSRREYSDLRHILSVLEDMLKDDCIEAQSRDDSFREEGSKESRFSGRSNGWPLNTECEFFDLDANRAQCAIGCDMYFCNLKCVYATNVPGTLPPYCTKYMKGRL